MSSCFVSLESQSSFPTAEVQVSVFDSVENRKEVSSVCVISVGFVGTLVDSGIELLTQSQGLRNLDFSVRNSRAGFGVNAWLESQL